MNAKLGAQQSRMPMPAWTRPSTCFCILFRVHHFKEKKKQTSRYINAGSFVLSLKYNK